MSLSSVLVDRGRVWTYTTVMSVASPGQPSVPVKVEGQTRMEWLAGPWFDCRVDSPAASEADDGSGGRVRSEQRPALIYSLEDDALGRVELHADSRVEVDSEELGLAIYEVAGEPTIDRKKSDLVCGEATLKHLLDPWPQGRPTPGVASLTMSATGVQERVSDSGASSLTISATGSGSVS